MAKMTEEEQMEHIHEVQCRVLVGVFHGFDIPADEVIKYFMNEMKLFYGNEEVNKSLMDYIYPMTVKKE